MSRCISNFALISLLGVVFFSCNNPEVPNAGTDYTVNLLSSSTTGAKYSYNFDIKNMSNTAGTEDIVWNVYESDDTTFDGGDVGITTANTTAALAGLSSVNFDLSGIMPAAAKTFYLIFTISSPDDTNSANNVVVSPAIIISPIFADDFEDSDISDWTEGSPADYTIAFPAVSGLLGGVPAPGSTVCLAFTDDANNALYDGLYHNIGTSMQPNYISWYARSSNDLQSLNYFAFSTTPNAAANTVFRIAFSGNAGSGGSIAINTSATSHQYFENTWYHFVIDDIDWDNQTFDVHLDGVLLENDYSFLASAASTSYLNLFNNFTGSAAYIDDVEIW